MAKCIHDRHDHEYTNIRLFRGSIQLINSLSPRLTEHYFFSMHFQAFPPRGCNPIRAKKNDSLHFILSSAKRMSCHQALLMKFSKAQVKNTDKEPVTEPAEWYYLK